MIYHNMCIEFFSTCIAKNTKPTLESCNVSKYSGGSKILKVIYILKLGYKSSLEWRRSLRIMNM